MLTYLIVGMLVAALLHFLALALGAWVQVMVSPLIGLAAALYWGLLRPADAGAAGLTRAALMAGLGGVVGLASGRALGLPGAVSWSLGGASLSALIAAGVHAIRHRRQVPLCVLCRAPALAGAAFVCPRCQDRVCARTTCWQARYFRCARCHEREIVILPIDEPWWHARLGRRVSDGQCVHCHRAAHEADLRECGQCRWPQCRRCWDYHNGQCPRCQWVIPGIPPRLADLMRRSGRVVAAPQPGSSRGSARVTA